MASRENIRKTMRDKRRSLSPEQQSTAAEQFANHFSKSKIFINSDRIAFYMANDGELDPAALLYIAWSMGKSCYLPVLTANHDKSLLFAPYEPGDPLAFNRFGIPEPDVAARHRVKARNLDLIAMPLVAFDDKGNRIGMGGGYYDRTLGYLHDRHSWMKPKLVGVGYEIQRVKSIESKSWDVPLLYIATEEQLLYVKR
ncbi:5-formyltetrahydrofolate cyclo-ligase [Kaarinaea lacus]